MAGDTRETDLPSPGERTDNKTTVQTSSTAGQQPQHELPRSQVGKLWDAFGNPEQPINIAPGAYSNAGDKTKELTVSDAIKSISFNDLSSFYKVPCARDSLLIGLGTGFGVGGVRGVIGGKLMCLMSGKQNRI